MVFYTLITWTLALCLSAQDLEPSAMEAARMPLSLEGQIPNASTHQVSVFLEPDGSSDPRLQFPYATHLDPISKRFAFSSLAPGSYWIVAYEHGGANRRGACFVQLQHSQVPNSPALPQWKALPPLRVSYNWGRKASHACPERILTLTAPSEREPPPPSLLRARRQGQSPPKTHQALAKVIGSSRSKVGGKTRLEVAKVKANSSLKVARLRMQP
jgi:hypothetical protein